MASDLRTILDYRATIKKLAARIRSTSQAPEYYMESAWKNDHGTAHVGVVDDDGNAVSFTSSINMAFGSKMLSPTGLLWNNEMDDFSSPGLVNHWGFQPSEANYIKPGRRPMSSMSPTIVYDTAGDVRMVTGACGGSRIISATAQTLVHGFLFGKDAAEITEAARVHNQITPSETLVDTWFSKKVLKGLKNDFEQEMETTDERLGVAHVITAASDKVVAAVDFRRDPSGMPAGF